MLGYVYLTYDTKRHKVYVGQHKSETYDEKYYGSGTIIRNIIKKRKDTLRNYVLEWCDTLEYLNESEERWIKYFREEFGEENCYNLSDGGEGAKGCHRSEETRRKISAAQKGHKISDETRKKMSEAKKGYKPSEETCRKISEAKKGHKPSEETRKIWSEHRKRGLSPRAKRIKNTETGQIWDCMNDCADFYNVSPTRIYNWLKKGKNNLIRL